MARSSTFARLLAAASAAALVAASWWGLKHDGEPGARLLAVAAIPSAAGPPADRAQPATLLVKTAATAPPFELLEVGSHPRSGRDVALMRIDGGAPTFFAVGDAVSRGARLLRILPTHVEIERRGGIERVARRADSADIDTLPLKPLRGLRHGADAAATPDPLLIAGSRDGPPPSSSAIDRAIRRAQLP